MSCRRLVDGLAAPELGQLELSFDFRIKSSVLVSLALTSLEVLGSPKLRLTETIGRASVGS